MSAARFVLNKSYWYLSPDQLLCQLSWMFFKVHSTNNLTYVFKCVLNSAPDLFRDYFIKSWHNYSTRHNDLESAKKVAFIPKPKVSIVCHGI